MPRVRKLNFSELWTLEELNTKITSLFNEIELPLTAPVNTYNSKMATVLIKCDLQPGYKIGTMEPKEICLLNDYILYKYSRNERLIHRTYVPPNCPTNVQTALQIAARMCHESGQKSFEKAKVKADKIIEKGLQSCSSSRIQASTSSAVQDASEPIELEADNAEKGMLSCSSALERQSTSSIGRNTINEDAANIETESDESGEKNTSEESTTTQDGDNFNADEDISTNNQTESCESQVAIVENQDEETSQFLLDEDTDVESVTTEVEQEQEDQTVSDEEQEDNFLQFYQYRGKTFKYYIVKKQTRKK